MENARVSCGPTYENFFEYATYEMVFSLYDTSIKDGVTCTNYERINSSYGECVNQVVKDVFLENLDCVTPWVPNNSGSVCEIDKEIHMKDTKYYEGLPSDLIEMSSGLKMNILRTVRYSVKSGPPLLIKISKSLSN